MDRRRLETVGVVVVLVIGGAFTAFLFVEFARLPLKAGSTLHYTISGSVNNTTLNATLEGTMDFRFDEFSRNGYSWDGMGNGYYHGVQIMSINPFYSQGSAPEGMIAEYHRIGTPLGPKAVATWLMPYDDHLVITEVGMESNILYQMVVSYPDFHYSVSLAAANNTNLKIFDEPFKLPKILSPNHPKEEPGVWRSECGDGGDYEGYSFAFGSVEIRHGENLKYSITGNRTSALFFSADDLHIVERTGLFYYNATISRTSGNPGNFDSPVQPGTYWYVIAMRSSGTAEEYWGS